MNKSYGCMAEYDDILIYNLKNDQLERHINKIVKEIPMPKINFKKEVNKVKKIMDSKNVYKIYLNAKQLWILKKVANKRP